MGAIELKEYIKQQMEHADERVLRIVASVFDNYSKDDNDKEILALLEESENEYSEGKVKKSNSVINVSREKYSK